MKKRAFVRYSKQGKIVPGSLVLTAGSYPQGSALWKEVPADLCCETPEPLVLSTQVFSTTLNNISVIIRCNSTGRESIVGTSSSTSGATLETVLNSEFSSMGTFAFIEGNTITLTLSPAKVEELACPDGYLSFSIFED